MFMKQTEMMTTSKYFNKLPEK